MEARDSERRALRAVTVAAVAALGLAFGGASRAADLCAEASRAGQPLAAADDPLAASAYGVWERVYGVFYGTTGRRTEVAVLGKSARLSSGEAFPPNAFICPPASAGAVPRMIVTWPMLELVSRQKLYDLDFLALVLGHELGHRVNDFDWAGAVTTPKTSPEVEKKADVRGAFFAAAAGYATRRLACDDALDLFLNVEANVPDAMRQERKLSLADVLRTFDVYESLYDAASALVFWDPFKGKSLLRWVDDHLTRHVQPIPEFKVLTALSVLMSAADEACWTDRVRVAEAPPTGLRCVPVFASHTAFWDELRADKGETRSCGSAVDREIKDVAVRKLEEALAEGADPLVVQNGLACAYAYLGDTDKAARALDKAEAALRDGSPGTVRQALAGNRAFIGWVAWMSANPPPDASAADADKATWGKALAAAASGFRAHPDLRRWLERVKAYPKVAPEAAAPALACKVEPGKAALGDGWSRLPSMPRDARSGGCPCGWSELHFLDNDQGTVAGDGVRTCIPAGWAIGQRWIDIDLAREQVPATKLLVHDVLEGPVASLRAWEKGCQTLVDRGVGSDGGRVFAGLCPDLGAPEVVLVADDCRVRRAVLVKGP